MKYEVKLRVKQYQHFGEFIDLFERHCSPERLESVLASYDKARQERKANYYFCEVQCNEIEDNGTFIRVIK